MLVVELQALLETSRQEVAAKEQVITKVGGMEPWLVGMIAQNARQLQE